MPSSFLTLLSLLTNVSTTPPSTVPCYAWTNPPADTVIVNHESGCYVLFYMKKDRKTESEALSHCKSIYPLGRVIRPKNEVDFSALSNLLNTAFADSEGPMRARIGMGLLINSKTVRYVYIGDDGNMDGVVNNDFGGNYKVHGLRRKHDYLKSTSERLVRLSFGTDGFLHAEHDDNKLMPFVCGVVLGSDPQHRNIVDM